jgi:hypothetical protein
VSYFTLFTKIPEFDDATSVHNNCNHVSDNYFQNGEKAKERTEVSKNAADQAPSGSHRQLILLVGEF